MNTIGECAIAAGPIPLPQTATLKAHLGGKPVAAAHAVSPALPPTSSPASDRPLHRLGEVRRRERLTPRMVARRLGISIREVQAQEQPSSDIPLSRLYRWQKVLGVPVAELLIEPDGELSPPVRLRARLVLAMKTVRSIQEKARQVCIRRLAEMLVDQLVEVMPELKDTAAWPAVGHKRKRHELGQAFFRRLVLDPLDELEGPEG